VKLDNKIRKSIIRVKQTKEFSDSSAKIIRGCP